MTLLSVQGLHKYFAAVPILLDISATLTRGERVGLIGRNGTGKTTLLRILAGKEEPTEGRVSFASGVQLGYLTQDVEVPEGETVWQATFSMLGEVLSIEERMRRLEIQMGDPDVIADQARLDRIMQEYTRLSADFERLDGYNCEVRVRTTLNGLGLPESTWQQQVGSLSGGQRTRVALARLLLLGPDILFLDEPTNHLDLDAITWLEGHLGSYNGALLVVSHDREFLDKVTNKTWELEDHQITRYTGNYSAFLLQKEEKAQRQELLYREQARERDRLEKLVAKFKAGTRSTMAKSWEKRLERMEPVQRIKSKRRLSLSLETTRRSGNDVLMIKDLGKAFPGKPLFSNFSAEVKLGECIALLGPNGNGKTTLLKVLLGHLAADTGRYRWGASIDLGYFSQDLRLPQADDCTVLDSLLDGTRLLPAEGRSYLGRFLFSGETVFQPIGTLSGGERNRLILAKLLLKRPNVLILDEPTNHLDIPSREVLEQALVDYPGTLFIVSHDRFFLRRLTTRVWHFTGGAITDLKGGYTFFLEELARQAAETARPAPTKPTREAEQADKTARRQKGINERLQQIEEQIAQLEAERDDLNQLFAQAELTAEQAMQSGVRYKELETELEQLYADWEECAEELTEEP